MTHPLTVVYLHSPSPDDAALLPEMEYGLSDAFRTFCRRTFSFDEPIEYPRLTLRTAPTLEALDQLLFAVENDRHFVSDVAKYCCLFVFDDAIQTPDGLQPLDALSLCGMSVHRWFLTYFPAIPKVILTQPDHAKVSISSRRWIYKHRTIFEDPVRNKERIARLFAYFWEPHFWQELREYVRTKAGTNWHTPGHNGGNSFEFSPFLHGMRDALGSFAFRSDLSVSVERLGDLSSPEADTPLTAAQRLASTIFGSAQTCFATNGTSTSNKAMLMTLLRPGEVVLVDRNCHKSVHHAVVMSGAVPRYLPARYNSVYGTWGPVPLEALREEIFRVQKGPGKPRLLIITTCTYEGVLYPTWEIGRLCEEAGILFYADEAWAPYLNFHPFYTCTTADGSEVRYNAVGELRGAHFSVQSTHKALSAFSQASMIHVSMRFKRLLEDDASRQFRWLRRRFGLKDHGSYEKFSHDLHEFLRYWHSTSPHYPMLATLDIADVQMRLEGLKLVEERLHWVADFKRRVAQTCGLPEEECFPGLTELSGADFDWAADGFMHDPLKMVVSFRNARARARFEKALLKAHIQWEKASSVTILFLVTVGATEDNFEYLYRVCRQYSDCIGKPDGETVIAAIPEAVEEQAAVLPRDAALCDGELVPLRQSEGRISGQMLVPYPPGIPVFLPGLRISRAMIDLIEETIALEGVDAVHGIFARGKRYFVEVLNKDEESRVQRLD